MHMYKIQNYAFISLKSACAALEFSYCITAISGKLILYINWEPNHDQWFDGDEAVCDVSKHKRVRSTFVCNNLEYVQTRQ